MLFSLFSRFFPLSTRFSCRVLAFESNTDPDDPAHTLPGQLGFVFLLLDLLKRFISRHVEVITVLSRVFELENEFIFRIRFRLQSMAVNSDL